MDEIDYTYDGIFEENILIVGLVPVKPYLFKIWVKINYLGCKRGVLDIKN